MLKTVSDTRWEKAQSYEKNFWERQASKPAGDSQFKWYEDRARKVWKVARPLLGHLSSLSILEIGSGPIGLVNYITADERISLDPLEDYYRTQPDFTGARDQNVQRYNGTGEDVESLGKTFSLIIADNVLDHVKDPGRILNGIHKSLVAGGIMFLSLNIYTELGVMVRNTMELLQIDKGHPFNFSRKSVLNLIRASRFKVLVSSTEDYRVNKRLYRESGQPRKVLKSCLGVVDYRFSVFCRKV